MKQTTRKCSKRLLSMLMAIALFFFNVEVASAVETTESGISVESDNSSESTDSVIVADIGDTGSTAPSKGESEIAEDAEISEPSKFRLDSFVVPDVPAPTSYTEVYERIIAWKDIIPTGTPDLDYSPNGYNGYLDRTRYTFKGGTTNNSITTGYGCAAFAYILSDAAFGTLPAKTIGRGKFKFEDIRVGDMLWINHYVIVLQTNADGVIIAEANNNGKVYWGRSLSVEEVMCSSYMETRYPDGFVSDDENSNNSGSDNNPETGISANRDLLITVMITALAILAIAGVPWFKPFKRKLRIKS